jgi:hypothetical protein
LVNSTKTPATAEHIAASEFKACAEVHHMSKDERLQKGHGLIERLRPPLVLSGEIVAMEKG